jgi:hypothetical protein
MTAKGADAGAVWQSDRDDSAPAGLIKPVKAKPSPAKAKTVKVLPDFVEPQLTKPVEKPSAGPGWAHEIKFDGYRMQLRTEDGKATLRTRKGLDWSAKFPRSPPPARRWATGSSTARSAPWTTAARRTSRPCRRRSPKADRRPGVLRLRPVVRRPGGSARSAAGDAQGPAGRPCRRRGAACAMSTTSSRPATRCCCRPAAWIWKASSPSAWTRPIARVAARPGPSPSAAPATRW